MKGIFRAVKWIIVGFVGALLFMVRRESIKETAMNIMSHIFFGEGTFDHYSKKNGYYTRQNYTGHYDNRVIYKDFAEREKRHRGNIKNYAFDSWEKANKVLEKAEDFINSFGYFSIGDLCDVISDVTQSYLVRGHYDYDYGWDDISSASINKFLNGKYVIRWPFERHTEDIPDGDENDQ